MAAADNPDVAQAAGLVKTFSADETRRWIALSHEKFVRDQATREAVAREDERYKNIRAAVAAGAPLEQVAAAFGITPDQVTAIVDVW